MIVKLSAESVHALLTSNVWRGREIVRHASLNFSRHCSLWRRLSRSHQRRLQLREGSCYFSQFLDFYTFPQPVKWTKENTNLTLVIAILLFLTRAFSDTKLFVFLWKNGSFQTRTFPREFMDWNLGRTPRMFAKRQEVEIVLGIKWYSTANTG